MKADLLHPDLSYKVIGHAFEVFNELGGGHKEMVYHKACKQLFEKNNIPFAENLYSPVVFQGEIIGKNFFDFLIDDKIVIELKSKDRFSKRDFDQLSNYLNISNVKLRILVAFTRSEVKFKRVLNIELMNKEKANLQSV